MGPRGRGGAMPGLPSPQESLSVRSVHLEEGACLRAAGVLLGGEREESLAEGQVRRGLWDTSSEWWVASFRGCRDQAPLLSCAFLSEPQLPRGGGADGQEEQAPTSWMPLPVRAQPRTDISAEQKHTGVILNSFFI